MKGNVEVAARGCCFFPLIVVLCLYGRMIAVIVVAVIVVVLVTVAVVVVEVVAVVVTAVIWKRRQ